MIVTIMQPAYLPWLGYFHRAHLADLHIVLDHVAIDLNSKTKFANRNRIRTAQGWTWLTVPLKTKGHHGELMLDTLAVGDDDRWRSKHHQALRLNYARAPHFAEHQAYFANFYEQPWERLNDLCRELTGYLMRAIGVTTPVVHSSTLPVRSHKDALILDLCREVGATTYLSGPFGRDYLDPAAFAEAGIALVFHDYQSPVYPQVFPGFEPFMSAVDLLFNCGSRSLDALSNGNMDRSALAEHVADLLSLKRISP